jgi:hypothetical protein
MVTGTLQTAMPRILRSCDSGTRRASASSRRFSRVPSGSFTSSTWQRRCTGDARSVGLAVRSGSAELRPVGTARTPLTHEPGSRASPERAPPTHRPSGRLELDAQGLVRLRVDVLRGISFSNTTRCESGAATTASRPSGHGQTSSSDVLTIPNRLQDSYWTVRCGESAGNGAAHCQIGSAWLPTGSGRPADLRPRITTCRSRERPDSP